MEAAAEAAAASSGGDDDAAASDLAAVAPDGEGECAAQLPALRPDPAAAAEAFNTAAEEASAAFKGKLAQRYFERAAEAEAAADEEEAKVVEEGE